MTKSTDNSRTRRTLDDPHSELLSRAYRDAVETAAAEPPRSVDDAVRAAAHQAVEPHPQSAEAAGLRACFRRWRTPLALAATLLLAVGIGLRVYKSGEMETVLPPSPTTSQSVREELGAKKEVAKLQLKIEEKPRTNKAGDAPSPSNAARPSEARSTLQNEIAGNLGVAGKEAVIPYSLADKVARARDAERSTAQAPQTGTVAETQEAQPAAKSFPGAAPAAPPSPPAHEPAPVSRAPVPAEATRAPAPKLFRAPLEDSAERTEEKKTVAAPETKVQLLVKRLDGRPAEAWIEEIRTLKREGLGAEAAELLAVLRKKFPDFVLPDDLK